MSINEMGGCRKGLPLASVKRLEVGELLPMKPLTESVGHPYWHRGGRKVSKTPVGHCC